MYIYIEMKCLLQIKNIKYIVLIDKILLINN